MWLFIGFEIWYCYIMKLFRALTDNDPLKILDASACTGGLAGSLTYFGVIYKLDLKKKFKSANSIIVPNDGE